MGRKVGLSFAIVSIVFFVFAFSLILPKSALSHHQGKVLGESTVSSQINFPPVTSGAGFILPDSPFYFLDKTFQQIRLLIAFTPESRAKVRQEIAGERLAELRIMLARNNQSGADTALDGLAEEVDKMAISLSEAAASGKDVKELAKEINQTIKSHRDILNSLESQAEGVLKLKFKTAKEALKLSKTNVEDELPEEELEKEIEEGLDDEIDELTEEATGSARRLEHAINVLERLASEAAVKEQLKREEALRHAIEVKNEALIRQQERFALEEEEKQKILLEARVKVVSEARESVKRSQEAAERLKKAQEVVKEAKAVSSESSESSDQESE
ncbi:MAG: hypothetical protein ACD_50C00016G0002 [uncultured bacterium]|nr:MAG: hypothetical protein ACD_50C00016G0002 [uncultured bacterium]